MRVRKGCDRETGQVVDGRSDAARVGDMRVMRARKVMSTRVQSRTGCFKCTNVQGHTTCQLVDSRCSQ